jgi:hypothetical protein
MTPKFNSSSKRKRNENFVIKAKKLIVRERHFLLIYCTNSWRFSFPFSLNKSNLFILCCVKNGNGVLEVLQSNYSVQSVWQAKVSHIFYWLQEISNGKLPLLKSLFSLDKLNLIIILKCFCLRRLEHVHLTQIFPKDISYQPIIHQDLHKAFRNSWSKTTCLVS